jgi:outer membrane protein assembly factor BamD (BamD/ComL family)
VVDAGEVVERRPPEVAARVPEPAQPSEPETAPSESAEQTRKPATPSADTLLERARSQRAAREFEAAARTYEELIRAYPSSAKARATHVSLAQLYQGPLDDPANALVHFDRYLERGGPLAEEAHYGKIKALRSLGRSEAAQVEIDDFLRTYPESVHVDALRGD